VEQYKANEDGFSVHYLNDSGNDALQNALETMTDAPLITHNSILDDTLESAGRDDGIPAEVELGDLSPAGSDFVDTSMVKSVHYSIQPFLVEDEQIEERWRLAKRVSAPSGESEVDGDVACKEDECAQIPSQIVTSGTDNERPRQHIEFDRDEKRSNVSFESQDGDTGNNSRVGDDSWARQSLGEETVESELVNSTFTMDSSISGQVELLRRDIEVSSLDIKEALRRVEHQKERVRSYQTGSMGKTPTPDRFLFFSPLQSRTETAAFTSRPNDDIDPAGRFVYLSRIANKFTGRSFPDEVVLSATPPRQESPTYRSPVLVDDKDLETLQKECRSVGPLVATFDRWTKEHVDRQEKDRSSPKKHDQKDSRSK
jgi:hypothetical protein